MTGESEQTDQYVPSGFGCYTYALKNYAKFTGRARRREYWMFILFNFVIGFFLGIIDGLLGTYNAEAQVGLLGALYGLFVLIPSIALGVRRLHDIGRTGWWLLISFIPFIGAIVLLVFFVLDSREEGSKYGPPRK
ncbi:MULTISPECIES: DUF805 domain-containing protein [Idiomarina]|uniref:Integral membrane protein n=1 Tax=Idiomarina baltica OS145 TaxID=314276 RepID=A0ABM9WLD5_9GAMM|nr:MULTISPECIES: DUF805 domain-containing protein [Idiomarina]EAQ31744.1 Integral membrane protein [Idiomarina baltica OS145]